MDKFRKIVIVPSKKSTPGSIHKHGCHQIIGVEPYLPIAYFDASVVSEDKLQSLAESLCDGLPVETDPDYYEKHYIGDGNECSM